MAQTVHDGTYGDQGVVDFPNVQDYVETCGRTTWRANGPTEVFGPYEQGPFPIFLTSFNIPCSDVPKIGWDRQADTVHELWCGAYAASLERALLW